MLLLSADGPRKEEQGSCGMVRTSFWIPDRVSGFYSALGCYLMEVLEFDSRFSEPNQCVFVCLFSVTLRHIYMK